MTQTSFALANWPPEAAQIVAAVISLALAAGMWATGDGFWRLGAALLVFDSGAALLPWRYPRSSRTAFSIWAEALLRLCGPLTLAVAAAVGGQSWLGRLPTPGWWAAAVAVAVTLVWLSGMPLRALFTGDLAYVAAPVSRRHKAARCLSVGAAPPGEEIMYRAPLLTAHGTMLAWLGLAGAAAFMARHYLAPGMRERTARRTVATQVSASVLLGLLTLASQSLYPALLAHVLNNLPSVALEIGRRTTFQSPAAAAASSAHRVSPQAGRREVPDGSSR